MPAINLPFNPQVGDPLDPSVVMANFTAITGVANGALEADTNVHVAAPNSQPGTANNEGVAATLLRSDMSFVVQGVENLAADPTGGNVLGRVYWNTVSNEFRVCTDVTGTGTYKPIGPLAATELVVHAAQHKDGGHDPLADNTLTDHMKAARTIYTADLGSDFTANLSTSAYTTVLDLTTLTTTNAQTVLVTLNLKASNTSGSAQNLLLRVLDHTASDVTIWRTQQMQFGAFNGGNDGQVISASFFYTTPSAGGARTLRLQAGAVTATGAASAFNFLAPGTANGDSTACVHALSAVIV